MQDITFSTFEMHGVAARRRVSFYGKTYDEALPGADFPQFLLELRVRMASWAGVEPNAFAMALINEYPPGAPIGWHGDTPQLHGNSPGCRCSRAAGCGSGGVCIARPICRRGPAAKTRDPRADAGPPVRVSPRRRSPVRAATSIVSTGEGSALLDYVPDAPDPAQTLTRNPAGDFFSPPIPSTPMANQ